MRDIRFLYWNTGGKEKESTREEVLTHVFTMQSSPEVLLLGECTTELTPAFLQRYGLALMPYNLLPGEEPTQQIYFNVQAGVNLRHITTDGTDENDQPLGSPVPGVSSVATYLVTNPRFVARAVLLQVEVEQETTLVASIHLTSKQGGHLDEVSQLEVASRYKTFIAQAGGQELSKFGQRIVVVGDFNMNPFDSGMLQPMGFYAHNNREFVRHTRRAYYAPELMFYNPCWMLLSDIDAARPGQLRVSGSHYYTGAPSKKLSWYLYDQIVLSESLIDRLVATELRVMPYLPLQQEAEQGRHPKRYSDHLPLCFTLKLGSHDS